MGAPEANTTLIYGVHMRESANDGSDFTNAAPDYRVLFLGEDGQLHVKDSAGTVTDIGAASGGVTVQDEGSPLSTTGTTLDFVGAGVTASGSGATKTITIPGGATFSGCRAYNSGSQTIGHNSFTAVTFDSEEYDTSTYHSTSSATSQFVVPTTGKYLLNAKAYWNDTMTSNLLMAVFRIDGTTEIKGRTRHTAGAEATLEQTVVVALTASQYVEWMVYQNSGSNRSLGVSQYESTMEVVFLG